MKENKNFFYRILSLSILVVMLSMQSLFAETPFCSRYGEKWVRILFAPAIDYGWALPTQSSYEGVIPKNVSVDYGADNQLWCFVGNTKGFKIYNKAAGENWALSVIKPEKGTPASMVSSRKAKRWYLNEDSLNVRKAGGYLFVVSKKENQPVLNAAGGKNGELKFFDAPIAGSRWQICDASKKVEVNFEAIMTLEARPDGFDRMAQVKITPDDIHKDRNIRFELNVQNLNQKREYYFPSDKTPKAEYTGFYRGFIGNEWEIEQNKITGKLQSIPVGDAQYLFSTYDEHKVPYRIPAIVTARNGQLIALSDRRYSGADIGFGRVDLVGRISKDNGRTWGRDFMVLQGHGEKHTTGYGDACLVADRDSNRVLLMCAAGHVSYWNSSVKEPLRIARSYGTYDPSSDTWKWSSPEDLTDHFYKDLFSNKVVSMFIGSGRIFQSRTIKVGSAYRIYAALCTKSGNFVVYSDDFGKEWNVLGDPSVSCAPKGDEPKCEELPDGSVLLSSRKSGGRWFNIYTYSDIKTAKGKWGEAADSYNTPGGIRNQGSPTDGEIYIVKAIRKADNKKVDVALQSVPAGPGRSNVTVYYKELTQKEDYNSPGHFAADWDGEYLVSDKPGAYSTFTIQSDGTIGFYFEEEPEWYQMVYIPLSLEIITKDKYRIAENHLGEMK